MSDLYDTDVLSWSKQQSALLRRLAAGERVNDQVDWENVIEEVDSVGRNELHRTRSLLIQALRHRLKILAWPDSREVPHWQEEAIIFEIDAQQAYQPAMRRQLDLSWLYDRAKRGLPSHMDGRPALSLPPTCPVTLEALLGES